LVVRTTAWDRLRCEQRRVQREAVAVMCPPDAANEAFDEAQIDWLREQLARFDPQLVRLIEMRFESRWTLARIAKMIGMSIGTVDGRLRRAIGELRLRAMDEFDE
jgi:RNA polymerase sigma factor (sigma-70 family)